MRHRNGETGRRARVHSVWALTMGRRDGNRMRYPMPSLSFPGSLSVPRPTYTERHRKLTLLGLADRPVFSRPASKRSRREGWVRETQNTEDELFWAASYCFAGDKQRLEPEPFLDRRAGRAVVGGRTARDTARCQTAMR